MRIRQGFRSARTESSASAVVVLLSLIALCASPHALAQTNAGCVTPPPALLSWWRGETNALDSAGTNNGTLLNGIGFGLGKVGTAFVFDGVDDFVDVPTAPNFSTNDFTVEFWVKFFRLDGEQVMVEKYIETFDVFRTGWSLTKLADNTLRFAQVEPNSDVNFGSVSSNTWTHIAVARQNGYITAFVNGVFSGLASRPANLDTPASLKFGHRGNPTDTPGSTDTRGFYLYGALDEVSIYNRALTTNEILAIYNAGSAGKCTATNPPTGLPPTITQQPRSQTNYAGSPTSFNVLVSGDSPLSFQWRFNGAPILEQTNQVFIIASVQTNNAGNYSVIVSNPYGSVTSAVATLTVLLQPPYITSQPASRTNYAGSTATFSVTAGGTAPLSYHWFHYTFPPLAGKTTSTLTLTNVFASDQGSYFCVVTNGAGAITSSVAVLTVLTPPPCANIFSNLVSWWRAENNAKDNWGSNDGTESAKYATGKVGMAFSLPQIRVTNSPSLQITSNLTIEAWINPSTSSTSVTYTVLSKFDSPSIIANGGGTQCSYLLGLTNSGHLFAVLSATGSGRTNTMIVTSNTVPINQWTHVAATYDGTHVRLYINGVFMIARDHFGGIFSGAANVGIGGVPVELQFANAFSGLIDELSLYNRALSAEELLATYRADLTGKCLQRPIILARSPDQYVPLGEDVKFTVTAIGNQPLKYQWFFKQVPIVGATNSALVLEKIKTNQAGSYQISVTNAYGFADSAAGPTLTVLPAPVCTTAPDGLISWWPADGTAQDAMNANNIDGRSGTFTYVTGKVDRAFSFNGLNGRATVSNSPSLDFGSNVDFTVEAWIKSPLTNTTYPNVPIIEKRPSATLWWGWSLSLNQGRLAFAMRASDSNVGVSNYISSGPDLRDSMYHHIAVSLHRNATNGGNLYVDGQPVLTFDPLPHVSYLFNQATMYIGGPTTTISNSYFFGQIDEPAIYNRALSAAEILGIRAAGAAGKCKMPPAISVHPVSQRVTIGSNVTFSVAATGSPLLRYLWAPSNDAYIPGATNASYTFTVQSNGSYRVVVFNLFGQVMSSNATLTANHVPEASASITATLNEDTSTNIILIASDADKDPLTYTIVTPPAHGTLGSLNEPTVPVGTVIYTPAPNYNGSDSFSFKVNDGLVDSAPATVNIFVLPVNDPPVAQSQSVALDEDTTAAITLAASDVDGDPLTFTVSSPTHGTLTGTPPNLVYRPSTNYNGPDSFTFFVNDGQTNSQIATVSITVRPVNDTPFAKMTCSPLAQFVDVTNQIVIAPVNGDAAVVLDASQSFDVENDPLQYVWSEGTNQFATGVIVTNQFAPATHEITLTVSDGQATGTASTTLEVLAPAQSVALVIAAVNDSDLANRDTKPLLASLNAAARAFDRGNQTAALNELRAFENKVRAQIAPTDPDLAAKLLADAGTIIHALAPPSGKFKSADE